jgi:transposase
MSLFDNLSSLGSDSELDLDLYELQLVLNGQSDSDSEPSEHEPLSEAEASNIGAIPPIRTDTEDSTASQHSKKPYFYTVGTRILALTRKRDGIPIHEITHELGMSKSAINRLQVKAISRGWSPDKKMVIEPYHVDDTLRSGRPKTSEAIIELILKTMLQNSTTRGWSCNRIASEVSETGQLVSASTVYRVLKEHGYGVYKRTVKPGLTKEQMKERLAWCLDYKDWTLEDWKNVIWTDETGFRGGCSQPRSPDLPPLHPLQEDMPQEVIQAWIERIPEHIKEVIDQEGNNLYKEGRKKGQEKRRIH